jgi:hypothetical protein
MNKFRNFLTNPTVYHKHHSNKRMKTAIKIISENTNRRENLIISFLINFKNVQNFGKLPKYKSFEI